MARTRSSEVHNRTILAALKLFSERGFDAASMDAIAAEAGVTKATLYNHWADKEALMMAVMLYVNGVNREREDVDTGNLKEDIAIVLTRCSSFARAVHALPARLLPPTRSAGVCSPAPPVRR